MSQSIPKTVSGTASPEAQFHLPSTGRPDSPATIDFNNNHNHNDVLRSSHIPQNADVNQQHGESFAQGGVHAVYNSSNHFLVSDFLSDSDSLILKPPPPGMNSPGDFGAGPFRSSFSSYNGVNSTHLPHSTSGNPPPSSFRMRQVNGTSSTSHSFASVAESFATHPLGIQHQLSQQSQPGSTMPPSFESRSMDFGGSPPLANKMSQQFALDPFLQSHAAKAQLHESFHPLSHSNSTGQAPYLNGIHLQSQTPYGPHLQSSVGAGASNVARGLGSTGQLTAPTEPQGVGNQQEEISTIFVVGFPDDMQEREFQNMFTFSSGFEAATLKIPNKEYTAYGSSGGTPSGPPLRASSSYSSYFNPGPNDPYNIVTLNQGGVVVDNGRDGPTTSWPPLPLNDEHSHFQGVGGLAGQPPRKQIIGFAKFRTRQEALEARDMLQGRRVDIEKGAVLKAEMAKKNLHTKRGVGIGSTSSSSGSVSLGNNMSALAGLNGGVGGLGLGGLGVTPDTLTGLAAGLNLNSSVSMNALASLSGSDSLARGAELNALGAMGYSNLGGGGWREGRLGDSSEDERERDRDRDREKRREAIVGLGMSIGRGARERALADEEERERLRRKDFKIAQGEPVRMLSGNSAVYDAFHPISTLSRNLPGGLLSSGGPPGEVAASAPHAMLGNSFGGSVIAQTSSRDESGAREPVGPWDQPSPRERDSVGYAALSSLYGVRKGSVIPRQPSPRDNSPPKSNIPFSASLQDEDGMLPPHRAGPLRSMQSFASAADDPIQVQVPRPPAPPSSSTSSVGGLDDVGPVPLTVSTSVQPSTGNTSPQLPSPASHAGSTSSGGGHATSSSSGPSNVGGIGPRNPLVDHNPPINTLYVGNLPTSPVGGGYPANYLEDSLRELFSRRPGYRKLCFRQKSNGPMCFVEFEDVHYATKALNELYGNALGGLAKNGGIRLSYSKNPLGVRTPTTGSSSQQQSAPQSAATSPFPTDTLQFRQGLDGDSGILNIRRESTTATSPLPPSVFGGYARSPPPPRFVSPPPPAGSFNLTPSTSPTNATTLTRGSHPFGITLGGTGGATNFSPFGLPLSSPPNQSSVVPPSHPMIPDHPNSDVPLVHGHPQHFPHRALSPSSSTVEAAKAG